MAARRDGKQISGGKQNEQVQSERHYESRTGLLQEGRFSSFSLALRMAWANAKTQNAAKEAAKITEETHTWYGWKELGYEVAHESKALYQASVNDPATKSGKRILSFFGASQVQSLEA